MGGDALVYGLNTMVGSARDVRLPEEAIKAMQPTLVVMHAGAMGDPLPSDVVRVAMAARLNGIARGGSGASPAVATMLAAMLNEGIHPVVPSIGSVGAGDLGNHATIALVALGIGQAEVRGRTMSAAEALTEARLEPLVLEPKDGPDPRLSRSCRCHHDGSGESESIDPGAGGDGRQGPCWADPHCG